MPRPTRNPFYAILGVVGVVFAITASSYCLSVLRGLRPQGRSASPHVLERWMDRHGTTALAVELVLLAVATFGAIAVDEIGQRHDRRRLDAEPKRHPTDGVAAGGDADGSREPQP
ncbi:MAG: hypothetical protein ACKOTB_18765 [Planctomycetia bacterium]